MGCKYKQRNKIFKQSYYILSRLFSLIFFKGKNLGRHLSLTRTSEEFRFLLRRSGGLVFLLSVRQTWEKLREFFPFPLACWQSFISGRGGAAQRWFCLPLLFGFGLSKAAVAARRYLRLCSSRVARGSFSSSGRVSLQYTQEELATKKNKKVVGLLSWTHQLPFLAW